MAILPSPPGCSPVSNIICCLSGSSHSAHCIVSSSLAHAVSYSSFFFLSVFKDDEINKSECTKVNTIMESLLRIYKASTSSVASAMGWIVFLEPLCTDTVKPGSLDVTVF